MWKINLVINKLKKIVDKYYLLKSCDRKMFKWLVYFHKGLYHIALFLKISYS